MHDTNNDTNAVIDFRHVSGILSTYDGEGNPYRKLSVFALSSPVVLHTLVAIATEWMFNQGGTRAQVTVARQNRALRSLRQTLSSLVDESPAGKPADRRLTHSKTPFSPHEAALAACLLQVAQVVFSGGTSAEAHLNCSIYLLRELDYIAQPVTSFVARLLTQRFAILDVTAALLHRTRPRAPLSFWMYQVNEDLDFSEPSMHQMTGCPQPVLSALAHIAHLASDLRQFPERKSHILMEGYRLESRLRCWALRRFPEKASFYSDLSHDNEDIQRRFPLASKFHLELVNECFYWLAHLLLQRRIYRDATTSDRVQQTVKTVFGLMKSIPPTSGPASSLPVPFYMVAREAVSDQDRSWVRGMHTSMINVYRNKSRGPMMAMTEEIWRHADLRREASGASQFSNEEDEAQLIALETKNRQFIF
ncbi:hypothetical protein A1O3_10236 [Capronia epimyces CBS 606.96]|uniref:Transcription factor domain-containing protein n=1 Tax=Capronia epimyces CBS 606.96 TaxID=1182542 RepID=W9XA29_9EURO|nr:uncharacterized protein A1O3_10236 [Capronia epimyces CBS 606.96]EXJ77078.1 hypothetical protein A1O3_10236 [Capronia epimyces CBS 606.96]